MIELNLDNLETVDESIVQLLVDAKYIRVTREWWRADGDVYWSVRDRQNRKFRAKEFRGWDFPCGDWRETPSVPAPGPKRNGLFVAEVVSEFAEHLVEFRILNREALR